MELRPKLPAVPPLPTPLNFPFQVETGIQTSKMMFDTLVGLIAPRTRQIATGSVPLKVPNTGEVVPGAVVPIIVVGPAGNICVSVIVVSGNAIVARLAHDATGVIVCAFAIPVPVLNAAAIASARLRIRNLSWIFIVPSSI